jgi:phospholipid/cholesterol/gamma-HCH transport system substrate-binding protein
MHALSGNAYMLLEDKGTDMRPLVRMDGLPYPIIPTTPSILVRLDTTLTQISESFKKLGNSISGLLNKENLSNTRSILRSGKGTMHILETQTLPSTNTAIENFSSMTEDLSSVTEEIKENPAIILRGKEQTSKLGPGER